MNYYKVIDLGLEALGLKSDKSLSRNLSSEDLVSDIVKNGEGLIASSGAAMIDSGEYTGRSPKDKYIVEESSSKDKIWWGEVNQKISEDVFNHLYDQVIEYYNTSGTKTYVFDGFAGADKQHNLSVRFIVKKAWQAHFVHKMFIRPEEGQLNDFNPDFTIINASDVKNLKYLDYGMNSDAFVIFHLGRKIAIIGGTEYGGEMKKGIFSVMHYLLPQKGILSMHCSANVDNDGKNPALFFGLSGTGKTTLSTDPDRPLIGDDEHGWSDNSIFNFEGGCYAKTINLNPDEEPDIYNAIRPGALLENVVFDKESKVVDYSDGSKTENTRVSYPINFIENSVFAQGRDSIAGNPEKIIFLTCDAYGILPPVAKLNPDQAMYHFISGYTAKVAGTERGVTEPVATFSPCFGGPFLTLHPYEYAKLLKKKMREFDVPVYLVNTGWVGASAGSGAKRISLPLTRKIIHKILDGSIESAQFQLDNYFGFNIPKSLFGVDSNILNPKNSWVDQNEYENLASNLVKKFKENYQKYDLGDDDILKGGPL